MICMVCMAAWYRVGMGYEHGTTCWAMLSTGIFIVPIHHAMRKGFDFSFLALFVTGTFSSAGRNVEPTLSTRVRACVNARIPLHILFKNHKEAEKEERRGKGGAPKCPVQGYKGPR